MPLVKVLSRLLYIFMYRVSFPHNTSSLLSKVSKISPFIHPPIQKAMSVTGLFDEGLAVILQGVERHVLVP